MNQRDAIHYIATRQTFISSALSGGNKTLNAGLLMGAEYEKYYQDQESMDYVVYSYITPIAWHTAEGWYVVSQKFSTTTSKHTNYVRRAIAESLVGAN